MTRHRLEEYRRTLQRIHPYVYGTALLRCQALEAAIGTRHKVFLKLENQQPTKSFKVRGAFNALLCLNPRQRMRGVVTRSSGNFAQAIAYASKLLGVKATIVMPTDVPEIKKRETLKYGAKVIFAGTSHAEGSSAAQAISTATGAILLSPYDHADVIAGQGTLALEAYEVLPSMRHFFCPIGGGGLMGGCSEVLKMLNPGIETVGIEPDGAADYYLSRLRGAPVSLERVDTICDGLRASHVGMLTRPLLERNVDRVASVSDGAVIATMKFLMDQYGLFIEPSGAVATAGLLTSSERLVGDAVCVVSGGNIDVENHQKLM